MSSDQSSGEGTPEQEVPVASFAAQGRVVGHVPVQISYGIIERFSEGLYSSPNKTFEELVTNAYDAGASEVWVELPKDLSDESAAIAIIDDGRSMDFDGLRDLWRIGESSKRVQDVVSQRKSVGKFGIGKLATYVLADQLTYIAASDGNYLVVTMDYRSVAPDSSELANIAGLNLQVQELTERQAYTAIASISSAEPHNTEKMIDQLRGLEENSRNWTAAIMTSLKAKARDIELGRLRWVLRTALPLNPNFMLNYNSERLLPSKEDGKTIWEFQVGVNEDELADRSDNLHPWRAAKRTTCLDSEGNLTHALELEKCGVIWGRARLFEKPLDRGKSEDRGRSHGIFVRVRGRLINLDQEDFALGPELRHGTLTRFHMEVNADGLDEQIASARENLKESPELAEFKEYLLAIFNRARSVMTDNDSRQKISLLSRDGRLSDPPAALSEGPLRRFLQQALGENDETRSTLGITSNNPAQAVEKVSSPGNIIRKVVLGDDGLESSLVRFDADSGVAVVNQQHPFFTNYASGARSTEALKLIGLTDLLTEAYLMDEGVASATIARVFRRRDRFLRALVERFPRSAPVIADYLRRASNNKNRLEEAVGDALELFGYDVRRLGGPSHGPDGVATARLGSRSADGSSSYAFTYDAKSSGVDAVTDLVGDHPVPLPQSIRADTARTSVLRVHREQASEKLRLAVVPSYTLLVAPGYQGSEAHGSLIHEVCKNDRITALTVSDLAQLVELFPLQGLNPSNLFKLFECASPMETSEWVRQQKEIVVDSPPPVAEIIDILIDFSEKKAPIKIPSLAAYLNDRDIDMSESQVESLVRGIQALAPKTVYTDGYMVALNASKLAFFEEIRATLAMYETSALTEAYSSSVNEAEARQ